MPIKAVLILDNAASHPDELEREEEEDIKISFLPRIITSLLQPMDHGVRESFKMCYRPTFSQKSFANWRV